MFFSQRQKQLWSHLSKEHQAELFASACESFGLAKPLNFKAGVTKLDSLPYSKAIYDGVKYCKFLIYFIILSD